MKITNGAILELISAIQKFGNADGKLGYVMARALRILSAEIKDYDEKRVELIQKYGTKDEEGNYSISPEDEENYKTFLEELVPILNYAIEVNIPQIDEEEFELPYSPIATVADYSMIEQIFVNSNKTVKDAETKYENK